MIWRIIGWVWRRLGSFRWPIMWLLSPKYTIGVNAIIADKSGRVWLQKHRFWPEQAWGLPGGLVGPNESPEAALHREIHEEVGLGLKDVQVLDTELFYRRGITLNFVARFESGQVNLESKEVLEGQFFAPDDLPKPLLPSHRLLIEKYCLRGDRE